MTSAQVQIYVNRMPFVEFKQNSWAAKLGALILNAMGGKSKDEKEVDPKTVFSWFSDPAVLDLAIPGTLEQVLKGAKGSTDATAISITPGLARALEQARKDKLLPSWVAQSLGGYNAIQTALER
jgi:hypothetical protein